MFELGDDTGHSAQIIVIGIGGGGGNAIEHMMQENVEGVKSVAGRNYW